MSRRDQIRMSDDEVREYLRQQKTLEVASINRDGTPHLVAMWYGFIGDDIVFWTYGKSQKIANLRRDPRLTCLVESGQAYEELKGVALAGIGEVSDDRDYVSRVGEAVFVRYNDGPIDDNVRQALAYTGAKRVAVTVKADRVTSWDHSKLGGTY